jgi:hypothetical protein
MLSWLIMSTSSNTRGISSVGTGAFQDERLTGTRLGLQGTVGAPAGCGR